MSNQQSVTGTNVNRVFYNANGRPQGEFRQTGEHTWVEFGKEHREEPLKRYVETKRDATSLHLKNSANTTSLQLNLKSKKVVYSDSKLTFDLYDIAQAHALSAEAEVEPLLTGHTVNKVDLGSLDGNVFAGYLIQTSDFSWIQSDTTKKTLHYFTETKRHKGSVFLFDVARYVTYEVNVSSNSVIYTDDTGVRRKEYVIQHAYSRINAQLANRVSYRTTAKVPVGEFRQVSDTHWTELDEHQNVRSNWKRASFNDPWIIHLLPQGTPSPGFASQVYIDLWTGEIHSASKDMFLVERASADPRDVMPISIKPSRNSKTNAVNTIFVGDLQGRPVGTYRQTGPSTWDVIDLDHHVAQKLTEIKRDHNSIVLKDESNSSTVKINLESHRITDPAKHLGATDPGISQTPRATEPIGYWTFDEAKGSLVADRSKTHIDGRVSGKRTSDAKARFGNHALSLNGVDNFMQVYKAQPTFNFGANQDFSVAFWVKADPVQPDTGNTYQTSTYGNNTIVASWDFTYNSASGMPFTISYCNQTNTDNGKVTVWRSEWERKNGQMEPQVASIMSTSRINDGEYHHIIFMKHENILYLYVDGKMEGTVEDSIISNVNVDYLSRLMVGSPYNLDNHFKGEVDDLRLYHQALTDREIATFQDDYTVLRTTSTMTGWLTSEITFGVEPDRTLKLNGVDDYAEIPNQSSINFGAKQDFTVAFWVKPDLAQPDTTHGDNDIVEKWSGSGGYPFVIRYLNQTSANHGKVIAARWDGSNGPSIVSNIKINDGHFHHIAFVKKGEALSLFIDGVVQGTEVDHTSGDTTNNSSLFIGRRGQSAPFDNFFKGEINGLRIFNEGITDSLLWNIYHGTHSPVGQWPLNDQSKNVLDQSDEHNHGKLHGSEIATHSMQSVADYSFGKYRQTGPNKWVEYDRHGNVSFYFDEVSRDNWSIFLNDPNRHVKAKFDINNQRVLYGATNAMPTNELYKILSESVESEEWLHSEEITSRSVLAEDLDPNHFKKDDPKPIYRTSIKVSKHSSWADIWASEQVTVRIDGVNHTIDPVKPVRVTPSAMASINVCLPADDVACPHLIVRTDLMSPDQKHTIFPDVEAHKKLVAMKPGELYKARTELGIDSKYDATHVGHVQTALQNLTKTVQHTYNKTPHGVMHDRKLHPVNMQHPHFLLDFSNNGASYQPLQPSQVGQHIENARLVEQPVTQNWFHSFTHAISHATKVVVHTVKHVAHKVEHSHIVHDIVQTAENVGHDLVKTTEKVGEDIVHGDIKHIGQDLKQGGENLGKDIVKGAGAIAKDVEHGVKQLIVMTMHTADEIVQFIVHETHAIGKAIGSLITKIGVAIEKAVKWLMEKLGWGDILHTHSVLVDLFNNKIDQMANSTQFLKQMSDNFFDNISKDVTRDIDNLIKKLGLPEATKVHPTPTSTASGHSSAMEKIEWIMHKLALHAPHASALPELVLPRSQDSTIDRLFTKIEEKAGADGSKLVGILESAGLDFKSFFTQAHHDPKYLLAGLLEIVKAAGTLALDILKEIFDILFDLASDLLLGCKKLLNTVVHIPILSDFYHLLTGKDLTLLDLCCLALAMPVTITSKLMFNQAPFTAQMGGQSSGSQDYGMPITYAFCHGFMGVSKPFSDVTKLPIFGWITLAFAITAQLMGNPLALDDILSGEEWRDPGTAPRDDIYEAPRFFAHITWFYQIGGIILSAVGVLVSDYNSKPKIRGGIGVGKKDALNAMTGLFGVGHLVCMGIVALADASKSSVIHDGRVRVSKDGKSRTKDIKDGILDYRKEGKSSLEIWDLLKARSPYSLYWTLSADKKSVIGKGDVHGQNKEKMSLDKWVNNLEEWAEWAPGGYPVKFFLSNLMVTIPSIVKFLFISEFEAATVGTVLEAVGHETQCITYSIRLGTHALK